MASELNSLRMDGVERGPSVLFSLDGRPVPAHAGESVAAALFAHGVRTLRTSPQAGRPRGMFCLMGSCQECLVWVGERKLASCQVPVVHGLQVETLGYREKRHA